MRSNTAFIGAVAALLVTLALEAWLFTAFLPGYTPVALFLDMGMVMKMVAIVIVLLAVAGLIGGLAREATLVNIVAMLAVAMGLLGAAYGEMTVQAAIHAAGPVRFAVAAPSRAESIGLIGLGLFVAVVSMALLRMRHSPVRT